MPIDIEKLKEEVEDKRNAYESAYGEYLLIVRRIQDEGAVPPNWDQIKEDLEKLRQRHDLAMELLVKTIRGD